MNRHFRLVAWKDRILKILDELASLAQHFFVVFLRQLLGVNETNNTVIDNVLERTLTFIYFGWDFKRDKQATLGFLGHGPKYPQHPPVMFNQQAETVTANSRLHPFTNCSLVVAALGGADGWDVRAEAVAEPDDVGRLWHLPRCHDTNLERLQVKVGSGSSRLAKRSTRCSRAG